MAALLVPIARSKSGIDHCTVARRPSTRRSAARLSGVTTPRFVNSVHAIAPSWNHRTATVRANDKTFEVDVRVDTPQEVEYYRSGGILPYVLRQLVAKA